MWKYGKGSEKAKKKTENALFLLDTKRCTRPIHPKDVRRVRDRGKEQRDPYL